MSLAKYYKKRDFTRTREPRGGVDTARQNRFVIQKHAASRLHYDFRLEMAGTLKSWAVPKGIPYKKGEKHLAVEVEDHPVSYIHFEGTIPKGQYGGGTVMVWDLGYYEPLGDHPLKDLAAGKLHFVLQGEKLKGEWYLVRMRDEKNWLLVRGSADMKPISKTLDDTSALSGRTMDAIARTDAVWNSNRNGERDRPARSSRRPAGQPSATERSPSLVVRAQQNSSAGRQPEQPGLRRAGAATRTQARGNRSGKTSIREPRATPTQAGRSRSPFAPLPRFIEPMKARLAARPPEGDWIYEIKFDGFRALAFKNGSSAKLLSRNDKDFGRRFPEVLEAVKEFAGHDFILDGEIVALDKQGRSSFQLLQAYDLGQEKPPIMYYVFDLLRLDGKSLQQLPLTERKQRLETMLGDASGIIRYSASLEGDVDKLLKQAKHLGLEGLIGKRADSVYEPGRRSGAWIKLKLHHEQEMVIGGFTDPEGSRHHFGSLLIGYYEKNQLQCAGKVGTGFDDALLRSLSARFKPLAISECPFKNLPEKRAGRYGAGITAAEMRRCHWLKPELVCQVKYSEWTRDGKLRHPVFLGLRDDKPASEVVRETVE